MSVFATSCLSTSDCYVLCVVLQGIEFLDMVLEWLGELKVSEEVKDAELESWLRLLLQLVDITGDNPAQYLNHFIRGREKIIKKYKLVAQNHVCVPQGWGIKVVVYPVLLFF